MTQQNAYSTNWTGCEALAEGCRSELTLDVIRQRGALQAVLPKIHAKSLGDGRLTQAMHGIEGLVCQLNPKPNIHNQVITGASPVSMRFLLA